MSASGVMQLSDIRLACQQRADMVNSNFITTPEWDSMINQSCFEFYDLVVEKFGNNYYVQTPYVITTDGINNQFALPSDFYKLLGVDLAVDPVATSYVSLKPFNFGDRNKYSFPNFVSFYGFTNLKYRVNGNNLMFTPIPSAGQQLKLWYIPRMTPLVNDTDTMDGYSGWLEYVITDVCIKALAKEESDTAVFMAQKMALIKRIEDAAENRDAANPATVFDIRGVSVWGPYGNGSGEGWDY